MASAERSSAETFSEASELDASAWGLKVVPPLFLVLLVLVFLLFLLLFVFLIFAVSHGNLFYHQLRDPQ